MLVFAFLIGVVHFELSGEHIRYHQHRRNPSEADLGVCLRCNQDVFLCTHLPIIKIDTFGQDIPGRPLAFGTPYINDDFMLFTRHTTPDGETETPAHVTVIHNDNDWNHDTDIPLFESMATIRLRGNSSRFFYKPNYRLRLVHPDESNNRLPLLGMNPGHEWALHGPFLDKTLMRNYMWMNMASYVMPSEFVPGVRFFELFLNGEFQGLYVLMETLRVDRHRVDMTRYRTGMPETSYFFRIEGRSAQPGRIIEPFSTYTLRTEQGRITELIYPTYINQNETILNYVMGSISAFERFLYSPEILSNPRAVERYIDIESFVNYFIINEFIGNNDLFSGSTYFHKDIRGRIVAGPVWDFNNIFDNFFVSFPYDEFMLNGRGWFDRLFMSPYFTEAVIRRWTALRRGPLAEERLVNYMDDVIDWLGSAVDRNFEVWGFSFDYRNLSILARRNTRREERVLGITIADMNPSSFEEAINQKRDYVIARARWMDEHIVILRQYSHPSRHALWHLR